MPVTFNRVGSMFTGFFTDQKVKDFASAKTSDTTRFGKYFLSMLKNGVNLAPSQFEAAFLSLAHSRVGHQQNDRSGEEEPERSVRQGEARKRESRWKQLDAKICNDSHDSNFRIILRFVFEFACIL